MNNTELLEGGKIWNDKTLVLIRVIPTGKEYYLYGKTADRYLARYINVEDRKE
jgi:hypothetical protein